MVLQAALTLSLSHLRPPCVKILTMCANDINQREIMQILISWDDSYMCADNKKKHRLLIFAHGENGCIYINHKAYSAQEFYYLYVQEINILTYNELIFISCDSANGFSNSFIAILSRLIPSICIKGFKGNIVTNGEWDAVFINQQINSLGLEKLNTLIKSELYPRLQVRKLQGYMNGIYNNYNSVIYKNGLLLKETTYPKNHRNVYRVQADGKIFMEL